jgi:hypothetical protein
MLLESQCKYRFAVCTFDCIHHPNLQACSISEWIISLPAFCMKSQGLCQLQRLKDELERKLVMKVVPGLSVCLLTLLLDQNKEKRLCMLSLVRKRRMKHSVWPIFENEKKHKKYKDR